MTDDETTVIRDPDAEEIVAHFEHDYRVTRYGTAPADVHVYCETCDVRYVIEDIPRDRFEAGMEMLGDTDG
jgi:hypothetical protein